MGNTFCNDCRNTTTGEICCVTVSTAIEPTFKMPVHFQPTHSPDLAIPIVQRLSGLQNFPLKIPKCGLIGLEQLGPYKNLIDENVYEGQWLNEKPEGKGRVYYSTGQYLEGEFHEGHPCGIARIVYPDGSYFQGQILDYIPSGGGKYTNQFIQFQGVFGKKKAVCGIIKNKDGVTVSFNLETGKGVIQFGSKRRYSGDLSIQLCPQGKGRMTFQDGTILDGEFRNGQYIGQSQQKDDMRSTTSDVFRRKSSKMSNNSKMSHKKKDKQFYGVTDIHTQHFMRVGVPEITKLSFSCQL